MRTVILGLITSLPIYFYIDLVVGGSGLQLFGGAMVTTLSAIAASLIWKSR